MLKEYKRIPPRFYQIMIIVFGALVFFIAFAPEVVAILASEDYSQATYIIPSVTASVLFMLMSDLFGNIEFFHDRNKFATYVSISIAVMNIILNYFGIKLFGYIAAGYTTLICYLLAALAHSLYVERIIRVQYNDHLFDIGKILAISFAMISVVILMTVLYDHMILRYTVILMFLAVIFVKRKQIFGMIEMLKNKQ